jgi:tetratricopeptide (TPR) repeat protein
MSNVDHPGHTIGSSVFFESDIGSLVAVHQAGANEAVAFYAARIVETTAADLVSMLGGKPTSNLYSNLTSLAPLNLLETSTMAWAHSLRRAGNVVRHATRPFSRSEAGISVALLAKWIDSYCNLSATEGNPRSEICLPPLAEIVDPELAEFLATLAPMVDHDTDVVAPDIGDLFGRLPLAAALAAEACLDGAHTEVARRLIAAGLEHAPDDIRLLQLDALSDSRDGNLPIAREKIERVRAVNPDDQESLGILGGICKRQWRENPKQRDHLSRSLSVYKRAWRLSKGTNHYVGINTAMMLVESGQRQDGIAVAEKVRDELNRIQNRIEAIRGQNATLGHWDMLTLAESYLIAGDSVAAEKQYARAISVFPGKHAAFERAAEQADLICNALGTTSIKCLCDYLNQSTMDGG